MHLYTWICTKSVNYHNNTLVPSKCISFLAIYFITLSKALFSIREGEVYSYMSFFFPLFGIVSTSERYKLLWSASGGMQVGSCNRYLNCSNCLESIYGDNLYWHKPTVFCTLDLCTVFVQFFFFLTQKNLLPLTLSCQQLCYEFKYILKTLVKDWFSAPHWDLYFSGCKLHVGLKWYTIIHF